MNIQIEQNTLSILQSCIVSKNIITFPNTLEDKIYDKISLCLESIGGKWIDKINGFLYKQNPSHSLKTLIEKRSFEVSEEKIWQEKTQFFPTPLSMSKYLVDIADIKPTDVLLEPSAGQGNILQFFPKENKKFIIEYDNKNVEVLKNKGYEIMQGDFLNFTNLSYDKVVMNPPFAKQQDIVHILHAYSMLNKGGTLVAVANENILYRNNEQAMEFKSFLKKHNALVIENECGSFDESGTMINTIIIKIKK